MKKQSLDFSEIKRHRRKRQRIIKILSYSAFFSFVIGGLVWLFIFSPIFRFDNIEVVIGDDSLKEKIATQLEAKVKNSFLESIFGDRNFLIWPSKLAGKELASLPEISELIIDKQYRENNITITATERSALGIWCLQKTTPPACFKFDDQGFIFRESLATGGNLIKIVRDFEQENLVVGDSILPEEFRANILSVLQVIEDSRLSTKEVILKNLKLQEVEVPLSSGPKIYFSLRRKADIYLEVLKSLSQEPGFSNYSYIDLRVENRVYYK